MSPYCVAFAVLVVTHLYLKRKNSTRQRKATSGEMERLPDATDAVDLFEQEPRTAYLKLVQKHGPTFLMHVSPYIASMYGVPRVVATCDPAMVKELLRGRKHVDKRPDRYKAGMFLPGLAGVLWMEGEAWTERRRALNPVFRHDTFEHYATWMHDMTTELIGGPEWKWNNDSKKRSTSAAKQPEEEKTESAEVDMVKELRKLATSFVIGFGCDCDPSSLEGKQLHSALSDYDEKKRLSGAIGWFAIPRFIYGLGMLFGDAQRIRKAVAGVQVAKAKREQDSEAEQAAASDSDGSAAAPSSNQADVDADVGFRPGGGSGLPSWLSGMVEANYEEKAIFNEVNHLHGAHKAAAIMWAFTLYELCKKPQWQTRLRDEMAAVIATHSGGHGDGGKQGVLGREDLGELKQTMMVWKEVLRMHPIALGVLRQTGEDLTLPQTATAAGVPAVTIPAGTPVVLLLQALHYHPSFWSDPTDFKPDRWDKDTSALHTASDPGTDMETASAFVPFLDGKRQCAGRFLAELEFVSVLHVLLRTFDFELSDPDYDPKLKPDVYPILERPMMMTVTRRGEAK